MTQPANSGKVPHESGNAPTHLAGLSSELDDISDSDCRRIRNQEWVTVRAGASRKFLQRDRLTLSAHQTAMALFFFLVLEYVGGSRSEDASEILRRGACSARRADNKLGLGQKRLKFAKDIILVSKLLSCEPVIAKPSRNEIWVMGEQQSIRVFLLPFIRLSSCVVLVSDDSVNTGMENSTHTQSKDAAGNDAQTYDSEKT